jgi:hypothetical protein
MKRILKINLLTADLVERFSPTEFVEEMKAAGFDDRDEVTELLMGDSITIRTKYHLYVNVIAKEAELPF